MSDELTGIFDHLTPDDFNLQTTAVDEMARTNIGIDQFNAFVDEQLRSIRLGWSIGDGYFCPVAVLANEGVQRVFAPDDEETLGDFVNRLHRESDQMRATWLFFALQTTVATYQHEDADAVDSADALEKGGEEAGPGLFWYAERREDERHRRHGIMPIANGRLGAQTEGSDNQEVTLFGKILDRS